MRKLLFLLTACFITLNTFAIVTPTSTPKKIKATEVFVTIGKNGERVSLYDVSRMKVKDLQQLTGKKMKFFDRLGFKISQKKLRNSINPDGTFNNKRINKYFKKVDDGETGFNIGGFALGFLLGLIGVLIAYLINDGKKRNRTKWAWIGLGVWIVIVLIAVAA